MAELLLLVPGRDREPVVVSAADRIPLRARAKLDAAKRSYKRLLELGLANPIPLEEIGHDRERLAEFDAMFVPGGHAPMVDLLHRDPFVDEPLNEDFAALVQFFHEAGRTTGLAAPRIDGRWIYDGHRMTCIKTVVDRMLEDMPLVRRFHGHIKVYPTELLVAAGAKIEQTTLPAGKKGGGGPRADHRAWRSCRRPSRR